MSRHRHVPLYSIDLLRYYHLSCQIHSYTLPSRAKVNLIQFLVVIPDMSVHIRHSCHDEMWFQLFAKLASGHITLVCKFAYHRFSFAFDIYIVFISKSFSPDIKRVKGYSPWRTEIVFSRVPTLPKHEEYYLYTNGWKQISCLHSWGS